VRLKEPVYDHGITLPHEDFTYGKANRPPTPVKAVISGFYGDVAEQQTATRYEILHMQSRPKGLTDARNHTRASQMASDFLKTNVRDEHMRSTASLFKMNKFRNVGPRTNTHNGPRRNQSHAVLPALK